MAGLMPIFRYLIFLKKLLFESWQLPHFKRASPYKYGTLSQLKIACGC